MTNTFDVDAFFANISDRWPEKGDRLFCHFSDWDKTARFAHNEFSCHRRQWHGYMVAGNLLAEICEKNPMQTHNLVYPILFNYRHGLELAMKWIIDRYEHHCSTGNLKSIKHHDLWKLWCVCKMIFLEIFDEDNDVLHVEQIIKDFHGLDSSAVAFRYPRDKNDNPINLSNIKINMAHLRDIMEGVDNFFTGADGALEHAVSNIDYDY